MSLRICHLQTWHSATAPVSLSRGDVGRHFILEIETKHWLFWLLMKMDWNYHLPATLQLQHWHTDAPRRNLHKCKIWPKCWCGSQVGGWREINKCWAPWRSLCFKIWTHARILLWGLTYALIFYYPLMSGPVVPLIKKQHRQAHSFKPWLDSASSRIPPRHRPPLWSSPLKAFCWRTGSFLH